MPKDALTPQARHHFTRFDQVDPLCSASEADALDAGLPIVRERWRKRRERERSE